MAAALLLHIAGHARLRGLCTPAGVSAWSSRGGERRRRLASPEGQRSQQSQDGGALHYDGVSGCTCLHTWWVAAEALSGGRGQTAAAAVRRTHAPLGPARIDPACPASQGQLSSQSRPARAQRSGRPHWVGHCRSGCGALQLSATQLLQRPQRCWRAASVWRLPGRGSWGAPEAQAGLAATRGLSASNQRQQTRPKRAGRWRWGQRPQRASYRPPAQRCLLALPTGSNTR